MIRTRIAPSPTGFLHIASLRQALFCYALAKKHNGQFVIRIEDTDQDRFVEGSTEEIYEMIHEFGLDANESDLVGGEYGPYTQSKRLPLYAKYAKQLLDSGHAYYCFLDKDELEPIKEMYRGKGIRSPYRYKTESEIAELLKSGKPYVIRLKVPENEILQYDDGVMGHVEFDTNIVGDEILIKSNGFASYHLAVVVDDYLMKITHPIRGIEWLPSTPKQILIYKFLGLDMPKFYHTPNILDPNGGKLSKRKGNVSTKQFLSEGYLKAAILNFIMLLGWSAPIKRVHGEKEKEIFSLEEFINLFELEDINKSNPVFNRDKLVWFNKEYFKNTNAKELTKEFLNWLEKYCVIDCEYKEQILQDSNLEQKIGLAKARSTFLTDLLTSIEFFYVPPKQIQWSSIAQVTASEDNIKIILEKFINLFENMPQDAQTWEHSFWEQNMRNIAEEFGMKHGDAFMVLRLAIVGTTFSPSLFECLQILGKTEVLGRITFQKNLLA